MQWLKPYKQLHLKAEAAAAKAEEAAQEAHKVELAVARAAQSVKNAVHCDLPAAKEHLQKLEQLQPGAAVQEQRTEANEAGAQEKHETEGMAEANDGGAQEKHEMEEKTGATDEGAQEKHEMEEKTKAGREKLESEEPDKGKHMEVSTAHEEASEKDEQEEEVEGTIEKKAEQLGMGTTVDSHQRQSSKRKASAKKIGKYAPPDCPSRSQNIKRQRQKPNVYKP